MVLHEAATKFEIENAPEFQMVTPRSQFIAVLLWSTVLPISVISHTTKASRQAADQCTISRRSILEYLLLVIYRVFNVGLSWQRKVSEWRQLSEAII